MGDRRGRLRREGGWVGRVGIESTADEGILRHIHTLKLNTQHCVHAMITAVNYLALHNTSCLMCVNRTQSKLST